MFQYYLIHYFNFKNAGGFMLVSLLCLIAVLAIVILTAKLKKHYKLNTQDLTPKYAREVASGKFYVCEIELSVKKIKKI